MPINKSAVAKLIMRNFDTTMVEREDESTMITAKLPTTEAEATIQAATRSQLVPIISSQGLRIQHPARNRNTQPCGRKLDGPNDPKVIKTYLNASGCGVHLT